jgi:AbrB family looped-hinge helix DNA binding protein
MNAMNIKIDAAGRIVLPKHLRERFRLCPGTRLELEERQDGLVLRPAEQHRSMARQDGIWVHLGKAPDGFRWARIVEDLRDAGAPSMSRKPKVMRTIDKGN